MFVVCDQEMVSVTPQTLEILNLRNGQQVNRNQLHDIFSCNLAQLKTTVMLNKLTEKEK